MWEVQRQGSAHSPPSCPVQEPPPGVQPGTSSRGMGAFWFYICFVCKITLPWIRTSGPRVHQLGKALLLSKPYINSDLGLLAGLWRRMKDMKGPSGAAEHGLCPKHAPAVSSSLPGCTRRWPRHSQSAAGSPSGHSVAPQSSAREQEQHQSHRKHQIRCERGKYTGQGPGSCAQSIVSLWEQEWHREMGVSLAQSHQLKCDHQRVTGLCGVKLSPHPLHTLFLAHGHFQINPCIAAILPWTSLPSLSLHQKEIPIPAFPIQKKSWSQKLPPARVSLSQ